jgi:spectinomycin phosphotransferase
MLEPPPLSPEKISSSLQEGFDLHVSRLEFLPIGNDSNSWVYKVHADNKFYFLKAKRLPIYEPSLTIPHYLKEQGLHQVVAPLPSKTQNLYQTLDDFALILYPFIDGDNGMNLGLTDKQWLEYGTFLKQLHSIQLPDELVRTIQRETFVPHPERLEMTKRFHAAVLGQQSTNAVEKELIDFWKSRYGEIGRIIGRTQEFGKRLQQEQLEFVLCHADIHSANLLINNAGNLYVVDWDQPILAPKERDFMFVSGSTAIHPPDAQKKWVYEGYGKVDINPLVLTYYCYEWAIQEFGDYTWRIFSGDMSKDTKHQALYYFREQFAPGNVIDVAYKAEGAIK